MALDFPSNPTDGQIYNNFIWSSSSGAWKARPSYQQTTTQSPLAPASPLVGDIWYNTTLGLSFTYYDDGTSSQWVEMVSSSVPAVNTIMPAGTIVQTARATAPDFWLLCNGSAISRTTYATLYNAIGTQYGSGDGSTTFNIPDLRGRVAVGPDAMGGTSAGRVNTYNLLGQSSGEQNHTLTWQELAKHTHPGSTADTNNGLGGSIIWHGAGTRTFMAGSSGIVSNGTARASYPTLPAQAGTVNSYDTANFNVNHGHTVTVASDGNDQAHNNMQPYINLNYMIKL